MDNATRALAKMNMILHGCPTADIWRGNTLADPHFLHDDGSLMTHDFVVANPPFSNKAWTTGLDPANDRFKRFAYGIPPAKNGDFAFLLHILASLKSTGKGAIILPHGVLFRGNAEAEIRQAVIRKGYIKGIIGLPPNLFYGTGIPACIIVLDKEHANARNRDIDALAPYWAVMPGLRAELFAAADRDGYSVAKLPAAQIKVAIHDHPEFPVLRRPGGGSLRRVAAGPG